MHGWKISLLEDLQDVGQCATIAALYITETAPLSTVCKDKSLSQRPGQLLIRIYREWINGK